MQSASTLFPFLKQLALDLKLGRTTASAQLAGQSGQHAGSRVWTHIRLWIHRFVLADMIVRIWEKGRRDWQNHVGISCPLHGPL